MIASSGRPRWFLKWPHVNSFARPRPARFASAREFAARGFAVSSELPQDQKAASTIPFFFLFWRVEQQQMFQCRGSRQHNVHVQPPRLLVCSLHLRHVNGHTSLEGATLRSLASSNSTMSQRQLRASKLVRDITTRLYQEGRTRRFCL